MPVCFVMRDRKGVGPDRKDGEKELERIEGGKTIFRIYCMKTIYFQ